MPSQASYGFMHPVTKCTVEDCQFPMPKNIILMKSQNNTADFDIKRIVHYEFIPVRYTMN